MKPPARRVVGPPWKVLRRVLTWTAAAGMRQADCRSVRAGWRPSASCRRAREPDHTSAVTARPAPQTERPRSSCSGACRITAQAWPFPARSGALRPCRTAASSGSRAKLARAVTTSSRFPPRRPLWMGIPSDSPARMAGLPVEVPFDHGLNSTFLRVPYVFPNSAT